ncbi:MAG: hypothetical protein WBH47_14070 [Streptosporangiaceae bacterium]
MSSVEADWAALGGVDGVPHDLTGEIMARHPVNFPPLSVQSATHGAPMPLPDNGQADADWNYPVTG